MEGRFDRLPALVSELVSRRLALIGAFGGTPGALAAKSASLAVFILLALSLGSFAGEIRKGATMQVKPDSIWFEDAAKLTRWQQLKKSRNSRALISYQDKVLSNRDAWQFTNELTVEILNHRSQQNQVNVEMKTPGRMLGTTWWLDADALVQ